jgi:hypothetical protein
MEILDCQAFFSIFLIFAAIPLFPESLEELDNLGPDRRVQDAYRLVADYAQGIGVYSEVWFNTPGF